MKFVNRKDIDINDYQGIFQRENHHNHDNKRHYIKE